MTIHAIITNPIFWIGVYVASVVIWVAGLLYWIEQETMRDYKYSKERLKAMQDRYFK